jgi:ketosteroid isomerase-like protein
MKSFYRFVLVVFLIVLFGCQHQQRALTVVEKEAIKKEVKDQFNQLISACSQLNVEAWSEFYSKDEFTSTICGTNYFATRSAWVDSISYYFSTRQSDHLEILEVRVTALTPSLALMTSEENYETLMKSGERFNGKHVFTMIWKKEPAGWKILHSHESWTDK